MATKVYEETLATGDLVSCRGRYWHMRNEHGILEDYAEPEQGSAPPRHLWPTANDLLVGICRCPIMAAHLDGYGGHHECGTIVLHQWANVPSDAARIRRWKREHHVPVPWVGHLESAPILFISSNPNLSARDLRRAEEVPILEPELLPELRGKTAHDHPSLRKPFRAPKWYWEPDKLIDLHENNFDVWVKDDGVTPLSGSSSRRRKVPYWQFAHDQAEELITGRPARPGHDYALTEVVHCKSAEEKEVDRALATCTNRYLAAVVDRSPARVLVVAGAIAAEAFQHVFDLAKPQPRTVAVIGPVVVAGTERLLLYTPHPGWLWRQDPEKIEELTLPRAVSPELMDQLRAAARVESPA